jgi:histone-lysine N-methyltransferase SETMAR
VKIRWKLLALILWDKDGILLIDYHPKGLNINAEYYSSLLVQLKEILKEIHYGNVTNVVLSLHHNAPTPWALATQKNLDYLGFQCLHHTPYSPNLTPSHNHLFLGLKNN